MKRYEIPAGTPEVACQDPSCRQGIYFVVTEKGKAMPVNGDGTPHWGTCPAAKRFKRKGPVKARVEPAATRIEDPRQPRSTQRVKERKDVD